jgi:hypothetical protein
VRRERGLYDYGRFVERRGCIFIIISIPNRRSRVVILRLVHSSTFVSKPIELNGRIWRGKTKE